MKRLSLPLYALVLSILMGLSIPTAAQNQISTTSIKSGDTTEVMSTPSGADPSGPVADNPAHGKPLDQNGVIQKRAVTYTYFKRVTAKGDSTLDSMTNKDIVVAQPIDSTAQTVAVAGDCWDYSDYSAYSD
jgi:hypothetical protein